MLNASRFISLFFIVLSCSVALYDDDLTDEDDGGDVYSNLISWQNALLWQVVPTMYLGMYMSKCKPWAHVAGIICGFATVIGLYVYEKDQQYWGSRYSVEKWEGDASDAKTWYFANGAGLWGGFANLLVTFLLNMLPGVESSLVPIHKGDSPHGEKTLTYADITETMKNTIEPIRSKLGLFCMITTFLLCNLSLPWYHEAYDGCNVVSLTQWFGSGRVETDGCDGPDMINGLPEWVVVIISCYIFAILSNTVAFSVWQPDTECNKPASSDELVGTQNTDTSKDEDTSKIEVKISSI